jgi:outer membrane protein
MNISKHFVALVLISLANFSKAQLNTAEVGSGATRITLQQAVDIALKNNIQVKQSIVSVQNSELVLQQSKSNKLPAVNGYTGISTNFGRGIDFITNSYTNQTNTNNNLGLNVDVAVYQGGLLQNTIKRNELDLKATQLDLAAMKDNIALQVVLAYLNILNFEDQLTIAKTQSDITKQQIERTEKLVRAGSLPQANVYDLKAQLANEETTIVNSQSNLETARLSLLQLMNDPNFENIVLDRISINTPSTEAYGASPIQVYETAEKYQAAIKAADMRIQSNIIGLKIAEAGFRPTISFSGGLGSGYGSQGKDFKTGKQINYFTQLNQNFAQNVGFNMNIPIFNRYTNKTRFAQSNLQKINSELAAASARQALRQNIEQAYVNMNNAAKRFESLTVQVTALEESFRAADSRFNAGAIDFVAYNLQKTNLDKARANQVQAKYDFVFRTKILDFYQNKPLTF